MGQPTFIVIGAQKAGTTSLHAYLARHPQIWMAKPKELHYFDRVIGYPNHQWYRRQFPPHARYTTNAEPQVAGEATPIYCYWPGAIQRMWDFDPNLKLIMSLRNPIDRALSHYWMEFQRRDERLSFAEALAAEEARHEGWTFAHALRTWSYLARGRYSEQLERIYGCFPSEQVLLLRFEDMIREPAKVLHQITAFIGVDAFDQAPLEHLRRSDYPPLDPAIREPLRLYFAPFNADLTAKYGIRTDDWV